MKLSAAALSATLAALVGSTVAQLEIISPGGPDLWWVAESDNVVSWTCKTSTVQQFTVLIANQNTAILTAPQAFIAQQNNFDCSKLITKDQVNMQPGTGYTIQLANIFNETDVYAESQPFEIKALGAAYPATSATPTNSQSATGAVSGSSTATGAAASGSSTATGSNGARALGPSTLAFAGLAALGLVLA